MPAWVSARSGTLTVMRSTAVVTVDIAAAAAKPSPEAIATWAGDQRVFVSSVIDGMADEREAVVAAVETEGAEPVWFEGFGGRDDDAQAAYLSEVASSTLYVGILGRTYGRLLGSRLSATHEEYREAERRGLRISAWTRSDGDLQGDQVSFLDEVRQFHVTGSYASPQDLGVGVAAALRRIAAEELSPWCMLADVVFRARSIDDDGATITVHASIHDQTALAAIEALRRDQWTGARETRMTWARRSVPVRVRAVKTTTTTSRATAVIIELDRIQERQGSGLGMGVALSTHGRTYDAAELTTIAVRRAVFGEPGPQEVMLMGEDLGDLPSRVPEALNAETFAATLGLVITEALIGTGRATQVTRTQISPPGPTGRRVIVEWTGAPGHGQTAAPGRTEGHIPR